MVLHNRATWKSKEIYWQRINFVDSVFHIVVSMRKIDYSMEI